MSDAKTPGQAAHTAFVDARFPHLDRADLAWQEFTDEQRAAWEAAANAAIDAVHAERDRMDGRLVAERAKRDARIGELEAHLAAAQKRALVADRKRDQHAIRINELESELARVRAEAAEMDGYHAETINGILLNAGDEFDGDEAADVIAVRYVRHIEAERDRKHAALLVIDEAALISDYAGDAPSALAYQLAAVTAERDKIQRACQTLGRVVVHQARDLYAMWIDVSRGDMDAVRERVLNVLPDVDDNEPDEQWNGTETGGEWFWRTKETQS
jgi:hypothetical protein